MPVTAYDGVRGDIAHMAAGEHGVLTADTIVAFEETGGSGGGRKLIPYTARVLDAFRHALLPWLDDLASNHPGIAGGKSYWAISPAARVNRATAGGIPIGLDSDAAYFGAELAALLPAILAAPPGLAGNSDIDTWRESTCAHLLACEELALISVWSPTFLLELLAHMHLHGERLMAALHPNRATLVKQVLQAAKPDWRALWPQLSVVSCWDQAASRPYADELRDDLGDIHLQGKGLLATEGVVSIPLNGLDWPVLAVESGFYEFRDAIGHCVEGADVTVGGDYDVLLTNWGGLYRYDIGDRVRVHGFAGEAPLLEFIGRGGVTSDLCGEKLTEDFVLQALQALRPLGLRFALLMPVQRAYVLVVDAGELPDAQAHATAQRAEAALSANPQYAYARQLNQLAPLTLRRCVAPMATWQQRALAQGRRLGDIKPPALWPNPDDPDLFIGAIV